MVEPMVWVNYIKSSFRIRLSIRPSQNDKNQNQTLWIYW